MSDQEDAARYRWLRDRYLVADFDWAESGDSALIFRFPNDAKVSANCDATIDAARSATTPSQLGDSCPPGSGEGWQPIETAPEETPVLVLRSSGPDIGELRWERPGYEDSFLAFKYWAHPQDYWIDEDDISVTHWMPFPTPPKEQP
jgi:hypothetical protein